MKNKKIDEARAIALYEKYGSLNRAALSAGCSPQFLKKILINNNIKIATPKPSRFNINCRLG